MSACTTKPDVRLVDAHAERGGRHHHVHVAIEEPFVDRHPVGGPPPRVIGVRPQAALGQLGGVALGVLAGGRVQQPRPAQVRPTSLHHGLPLAAVLVVPQHPEVEVRPVEALHGDEGLPHAQAVDDLRSGMRRRGCRQRHHGRVLQPLHHRGQRQVVGPEVVAPGGDAVRLVHHEQRDVQLRQPLQGFFTGQLFRGQEQELRLRRWPRRPTRHGRPRPAAANSRRRPGRRPDRR